MRRFTALLLIVVATAAFGATLKEVVNVNVVNIYLSAKDTNGRYVGDLRREEITVFENGVPQTIQGISNFAMENGDLVGTGRTPLTIALALDVSGSMSSRYEGKERLDTEKSAALLFIDQLDAKDRVILTPFGKYPRIASRLTLDKQQIEDKLLMQKIQYEDTALFDSLSVVIHELQQYPGRKVLVLCSDGEDNSSRLDLSTFLRQLGSSEIVVLSFTIPYSTIPEGCATLQKIADLTGGYAFFPKNAKELDAMLARLRETMQHQYSVWYSPKASRSNDKWRSIEILCRRPGVILHYRPGYFVQ